MVGTSLYEHHQALIKEQHKRVYHKPPKEDTSMDPNGTPQHAPGAKLDGNKPDMSLLLHFSFALTAVAEVGTAGAKKYTRGGWKFVEGGEERYTAALLRHLFIEEEHDEDIREWAGGEDILHDAQVAWNALARLEIKLCRLKEEAKAK